MALKDTINLANKRFGKLTVLYDSGKRSNQHYIYWHCKCDCGKELDIKSTRLINNLILSCGCEEKEYEYKNPIEDLSNQKFGMLQPIKYVGSNNWECLCDCGKICIKRAYYLKNGRSLSCGCASLYAGEQKINDILTQNNIYFEREKIFNDCINPETNRPLRFDFYVKNQYIIEFDGKQHFKPIQHFGGEKNFINQQKRDNIKNNWCKQYNIPIIRIPYYELKNITLNDLEPQTSRFLI